VERKVTKDEEEAEDEEDSGEVQQVTFPIEKSPLDALEALVGMGHE
jgi:hypothetical protein